MNADYGRIEGMGFLPNPDDVNTFHHIFNYERDHYPNGYLKEERKNVVSGFNWEPYHVRKIYRSEIDVVSVSTLPNLEEGFELSFNNPSNLFDQLLINKLLEGMNSADLWIIDASGKILNQRKVHEGDTSQMSELKVEKGIHYLTLFVQGAQKTWKLIGV